MTNAPDLTTLLRSAHDLGESHGESAGSWILDGNSTVETARWILAGIDDGDPEVMDIQPMPLSGEWADDLTPSGLLSLLDVEDVDAFEDHEISSIFDHYEEAFSEGFWDVVTIDAQRLAEASR